MSRSRPLPFSSYGFYLERPSYLSLALVTCSPNRAMPELACPVLE
ncbi:hypothetical protein [Streptomyces prunicolor]